MVFGIGFIRSLLYFWLLILLQMMISGSSYAFECISNGTLMASAPQWRQTYWEAMGKPTYVYSSLWVYPDYTVGNDGFITATIDLSRYISCRTTRVELMYDTVKISKASLGGLASDISTGVGRIIYDGVDYNLPILGAETHSVTYDNDNFSPWPAKLIVRARRSFLTEIASSERYATIILHKQTLLKHAGFAWPFPLSAIWWGDLTGLSDDYFTFFIRIPYITIPPRTCDISSTSIVINLPDYKDELSAADQPIPLSISCKEQFSVEYSLSGQTVGADNKIFKNVASAAAAEGIGFQIYNSIGIVSANKKIPVNIQNSAPVDLGLRVKYARTGGVLKAGNVQALITLTFTYF